MDKCYSADNENFNYTSLGEIISDEELVVGQIIYEADAVHVDITQFVDADDVIMILNERACDSVGECAEDFPNCSTEAVKELDKILKEWVSQNCQQPFWHVHNSKEYTITEEDMV